jgi:hypothetical protein
MAKKLFLHTERSIPTAQVPSVSRGRSESDIASTSGNSTNVQLHFKILDETSKSFPEFKATGRSMLIKFNSPGEEQQRTAYLRECIAVLINYLVREVPGRDLVGLRIRNTDNVQD